MINETIEQLEEDDEWDPDWRPWDHFPHPDADASVLSDHRWASLNVLVQQDWFRRGWVVREAGLAREGLVIWGQTEFSWDLLMRTLSWTHRRAVNTIAIPAEDCFRSHLEAYEAQHQDTVCVFYQESSWKACSLLDYIHFAGTLRLTDSRDRIYAFLDIADESRHQLNVIPNYSDTPSKVYRDFATHYICTTGDVNILHYVKHDGESLKSGFMTWAPQWNMRPDNLRGFVSPNDHYPALTSRTMQTYKPVAPFTSKGSLLIQCNVFLVFCKTLQQRQQFYSNSGRWSLGPPHNDLTLLVISLKPSLMRSPCPASTGTSPSGTDVERHI